MEFPCIMITFFWRIILKKILFIIVSLFFLINTLKSSSIYKSAESTSCGVMASTFVKGAGTWGANPGNLIVEKKTIGLSFNQWLADSFLINSIVVDPYTVKNMALCTALDLGYFSTGSVEFRDNNGDIYMNNTTGQYIISLLSAVQFQEFQAGIDLNNLLRGSQGFLNSEFSLGAGTSYKITFLDYNVLFGLSAHNLLMDNDNEWLPFELNDSIGIEYLATSFNTIGFGIGHSFDNKNHIIGTGAFYEDMAGLSDSRSVIFRFTISYQSIPDEFLVSQSVEGLKFGLDLYFDSIKIFYSFENRGIAGTANRAGVQIELD